ncbi:uncharacterized protein Dwil_GK10594 [Drosophila willistoni]|uniref:Protein Z600 n=1 Tax=Drosophila willistoni TaxID=7260 RepID=B4NLV8_DROWI|nr:protein Z600 [Drosophila willistoni]EDW85410.1 uncharacterized protein Dwil_GK10594 [Drosophila willistoni]
MSSFSSETNQILQRLNSLKIVETPKDQQKMERSCYSMDNKNSKLVPATPTSEGPGTFLTQLKKRRKNKLNRIYNYEANEQFVKARKSLNF